MIEFVLNIQPSPEDDRDWNVATYLTHENSLDSTYICNRLQPVRNQGEQGSCAAQTAACMKEWQEHQDYGFEGYMSPQFVYNCRSNTDTSGMTSREVMRILSKIGIVPEKDYTYGTEITPSNELKEAAGLHKISGYARVFSQADLKSTLKKNGPCLIAFPVYNHGTKMWRGEGGPIGGHAMTVVGYNEEGFIIRNSWGKEWGKEGHCTYPYDDWGAHWEIWTTVDAQSPIQPMPTPVRPPVVPKQKKKKKKIKIKCSLL